MEPRLTTINVGPRIEIYGPLPVRVFTEILGAITKEYPKAIIQEGDPTTNLLAQITYGNKP